MCNAPIACRNDTREGPIMEIQSFLICETVQYNAVVMQYEARGLCLHNFFSKDGVFPLIAPLPFFMLLRRGTRGEAEQISLRFDLVDEDGKRVGEPSNLRVTGEFPKGAMFMHQHGRIHFSLPAPGDYRLDITADEEKLGSVFQYNIEVTH
jgi:hypothetical protein